VEEKEAAALQDPGHFSDTGMRVIEMFHDHIRRDDVERRVPEWQGSNVAENADIGSDVISERIEVEIDAHERPRPRQQSPLAFRAPRWKEATATSDIQPIHSLRDVAPEMLFVPMLGVFEARNDSALHSPVHLEQLPTEGHDLRLGRVATPAAA
jgi:hypothetical protein